MIFAPRESSHPPAEISGAPVPRAQAVIMGTRGSAVIQPQPSDFEPPRLHLAPQISPPRNPKPLTVELVLGGRDGAFVLRGPLSPLATYSLFDASFGVARVSDGFSAAVLQTGA